MTQTVDMGHPASGWFSETRMLLYSSPMASPPVLPQPLPPSPETPSQAQVAAQNEAVQKALEFARQTGQSEIDAIERLHKRTLLSLAILVALFSFIGYQNLSRIATQTTTLVVQRRLEDQLTQKHIDEAVQTALQSHAEREIEKAVDAQVAGAVQKEVSRQSGSIQHLTEAYTSEAVSRLDPQI